MNWLLFFVLFFFFFFPACTLFSRWHTHKLKCKIRKYSLATRKKGGNESNTKQNKTKRRTQRHDPLSVRWHVVKTLCSQMKCHCWRQRVITGPSIDSNEMMDAHALFMFECADKSRFWTQDRPFSFSFLISVEEVEREKKSHQPD